MERFLETCLSWPALPASMLLISVAVYWLLMIMGAFDLDFLDVDLLSLIHI